MPDDQRSKTSAVASLLAAGWSLGDGALTKAKEYDEKHLLSLQLRVGAEKVKAKVQEVDEKYQISATAKAGAEKAKATAKAVDEKYQISATAKATGTRIAEKGNEIDQSYGITKTIADGVNYATETAKNLANKALENPMVRSGVDTVQTTAKNVTASANEVKSETTKLINEKKETKAQNQPPAVIDYGAGVSGGAPEPVVLVDIPPAEETAAAATEPSAPSTNVQVEVNDPVANASAPPPQ